MTPLEKLGAFYLGREFDLKSGKRLDEPVMYDARDLTTHAICVGMTGSGKTGLCIDLLEEAAIDGVPALLIDPKGDLTNLLLNFPDLRPEDFEPWINQDDARRKGMTPVEYARHIAKTWKNGLADWDQGPERIRMLQESAEFRIYTPGSDAGLPISILASLQAPALDWSDHQEELREQIQGTVSALLSLAGVEADPLRSREHILLSTIFEHCWRQGQNLDLAALINAIQNPPVQKLGVFDVETFFPAKDRFGLAMALNNIMAAPSFAAWLEGEPLDIASLLRRPDGKPRHSIFYLAHLPDSERMFFVTLLLEQLTSWVRQQSGTTSLRALLYMDEVFGYLPPVSNPPSKRPLLTLLKQARAYGVGVMLTTQNPVDLDYKSLTNAGTWFIGKLQADRDKQRVLDGLESAQDAAGAGLDRSTLDKTISALDSRVFLLHNVNEDRPVIFQTRWAMSYLRGPLTRNQVKKLKGTFAAESESGATPPAAAGPAVRRDVAPGIDARTASTGAAQADRTDTLPDGFSSSPPPIAPDLEQVYLPLTMSAHGAVSRLETETGEAVEARNTSLVYETGILMLGRVSFVDRRRKVNETRPVGFLVPSDELGKVVRWPDSEPVELSPNAMDRRPEPEAVFGPAPAEVTRASDLKRLAKDFSDYLYREQRLPLLHCPALKLYSEPGETERDFLARAQLLTREGRDTEVAKLRKKYQRQLDRLETRLSREERELQEDEAEYASRKREEVISAGETIIGLLGVFGRRKRSSGLSSAARKRRMTGRAKEDIAESKQEIARLKDETEEMRRQMETEAEAISEKFEAMLDVIEPYPIKPRRTDVRIDLAAIAWAPHWEIAHEEGGRLTHDRVTAWRQEDPA